MDIGSKIKQYRNSGGLTQKELAIKANISRSYLGDVEKNRYNASVETLQKIATALEIPLAKLLSTEEQLEIATSSLKKINETVDQYYAFKPNEGMVRESEFDLDTDLKNKIKKLSNKDRKTIEVLIDELLKEE